HPLLQRENPLLERADAARRLRRLLEDAQSPAAPEEHPRRSTNRRRVVRCRRLVRRTEHLSRDRAAESGHLQHARDGSLGAWAMAFGRRTETRPGKLPSQDCRIFPAKHRVAVLQTLPQRRHEPRFARGVRLRNRSEERRVGKECSAWVIAEKVIEKKLVSARW